MNIDTLLQTKLLVPKVSVLNRFILVMSMFSCLNLKKPGIVGENSQPQPTLSDSPDSTVDYVS